MTDINNLLDSLFGGKKTNFSYKENFSQTEEEIDRVKKWMLSAEGRMAFEKVSKAYELRNAGLHGHPEMHLLTSPYANGFAIAFDPSIAEKTFSDLFFAFGLRMLDLGYYRVSLDRTIREEAELVKTTEKQYFKPSSPVVVSGKTGQLFGNVSIEKELLDNKLRFLKVLVTVYSDQHYHDARPFDQFIEQLFNL